MVRKWSIIGFRGFWHDRIDRKHIADRFGPRVSNFPSYGIVVFVKIDDFRNSWIFHGGHGNPPWDPMGPHGNPWHSMGPMGTHGDPWEPMGTHVNPWGPMGTRGFPWVPIGAQGTHVFPVRTPGALISRKRPPPIKYLLC